MFFLWAASGSGDWPVRLRTFFFSKIHFGCAAQLGIWRTCGSITGMTQGKLKFHNPSPSNWPVRLRTSLFGRSRPRRAREIYLVSLPSVFSCARSIFPSRRQDAHAPDIAFSGVLASSSIAHLNRAEGLSDCHGFKNSGRDLGGFISRNGKHSTFNIQLNYEN